MRKHDNTVENLSSSKLQSPNGLCIRSLMIRIAEEPIPIWFPVFHCFLPFRPYTFQVSEGVSFGWNIMFYILFLTSFRLFFWCFFFTFLIFYTLDFFFIPVCNPTPCYTLNEWQLKSREPNFTEARMPITFIYPPSTQIFLLKWIDWFLGHALWRHNISSTSAPSSCHICLTLDTQNMHW